MRVLSLIVIISFISAVAFAQAGNLDNTFDTDGKVVTNIGSGGDYAYAVAVQPDGKIVTAGYFRNVANNDFVLVRCNSNGTLDNSFGTAGIVITDVSSGDDYAYSVAIQNDGKIIAGGSSNTGHTLIRYNSNGTLDNNFGNNGKVITGLGVAYSIAIQPDGKIVAGGPEDSSFAVVRLNTDGSLDNSFSDDGKVGIGLGFYYGGARSMAIQPDGKIVEAGQKSNGYLYNSFVLIRFNSDGSIDSSFGIAGIVTTVASADYNGASSVLVQPDGKIIAGGFSTDPISFRFVFTLIRYKPDGTIDSSFDDDGIVTTDFGGMNNMVSSMVLQTDGKIVAAGNKVDVNWDFALVRYTSDGAPDNSFGNSGKVTTNFSLNSNDALNSAAIQPDGKIVVAGSSGLSFDGDFALARYISGLNVGIPDFSSIQSPPLIYSNPIQETENFKYTLIKNESFSLRLYDMNGRVIKTFFTNEPRVIGEHTEELNFGNLASGNYLLTLSNGSQQESVKIVKQ